MGYSHYFHCATKGLQDDILFPSTRAFIAGMNRIGVTYLQAKQNNPVIIIAFCLMDNHVHFILYGTYESCLKFMCKYRILTEMWFAYHPDEGRGKKKWDIGIWRINDQESLIEKIAYVLRNPTAAGMPVAPYGYRWSSANLMFTENSFKTQDKKHSRDISLTKNRKLFNTKTRIPKDWMLDSSGMIWPGCYTDYERTQRLFKTVSSFNFEMNRKIEDQVNAEMLADSISLPDSDILEKAEKLSSSLFDTGRIKELSVPQRTQLAKILKKETGALSKQLSRIVGIRQDLLKELI